MRTRRPRNRDFVAFSDDSDSADDVLSESDQMIDSLPDSDSECAFRQSGTDSEPEVQAKPITVHQIALPDWKKPVVTNMAAHKLCDPVNFSFVEVHGRLETIESRIVGSQIPKYKHPAQVVVADREIKNKISLTPLEEDKRSHYVVTAGPTRVPDFWPARYWDRPEDSMSSTESRRLAAQISETRTKHLEPAKPQKTRKSDCGKHIVRREPVKLVISRLDYNTDDYDEETDFQW